MGSAENMGLWRTRHHSMEMLAGDFMLQAQAIEKAFQIVDECIGIFDSKAANDDYHRICGLVLAKGRHYTFGSYSLILDGLGQEAGALLRPSIEYHELLTYFRLDPTRVQKAVNDNLPSAGERAKMIQGYFRKFRKYLNENASHSSFSYYSLNHLLDKPEMKIRKEQPMLPKVLFRNMGVFFVLLILMGIEAINCLRSAEIGCAEKQAEDIEALRKDGIGVFRLNERVSVR